VLGDTLRGTMRRYGPSRAILLLIDTLEQHDALVAASAMAFDAFLSLVPLAALAGLVMHRLHESGDLFVGAIFRASPKPVADLILGSITRLSDDDTAVVAPLSLVAFIWTTSAGVSTAMAIFEKMFHSPPRPWWVRRGIAMGCVFASIAILAGVTAAAVGIQLLSRRAGAIAAPLLPGATVLVMLAAFFRISVRNGPVASASATPLPASFHLRRRLAPGVILTFVLWAAVSGLFSFYVATLARYATLYGQLAAVAIFLFWLWLLALALLVGGEVNAQLDGLRAPAPPPR
jgi:membrane protein